MRKLIFTMGFILISLLGFSQATPTQVLRIADANTDFGVNISVGKLIYDINSDSLWVAKVGLASNTKLSAAILANSVSLVNSEGTTDLALGTVDASTVQITSSTGTNATLGSATTSDAGLMSAAKFNEVEANTLKETNVSTELSIGTRYADSLKILSDGTSIVLDSANATRAGLLTATQFNKLSSITAGAEANYTMATEKFEETSGTALTHTLAQTIQTAGSIVSLNGHTLNPADYTLTATTVKINLPVAQYDIVVITYNY